MDFETLITGLQQVAREEIVKKFHDSSCIASTRIIVNVLQHYGFRAEPLAVKFAAYNRHFNLSLKRLKSFPMADPLSRERIKYRSEDAKAICIGYGSDNPQQENSWDGHLIAWVSKYNWMIDASISQAKRPERELDLPNVLTLQADAKFAKGIIPLCTSYKGCLIRYDAAPKEVGFKTSNNWQVEGKRESVVNEVVDNIIARIT